MTAGSSPSAAASRYLFVSDFEPGRLTFARTGPGGCGAVHTARGPGDDECRADGCRDSDGCAAADARCAEIGCGARRCADAERSCVMALGSPCLEGNGAVAASVAQ